MSRLDKVLERARVRPLIVPFVTAGFPELGSTPRVVRALVEAGADMIEIGMPFSDPLADGPTIQAASERALANGMTLAGVLDVVREVRADSTAREVPILLMGYCNPLYRYGLDRFLDAAVAAGVDGLIVPDLIPEEAADYRAGCASRDLAAVFLMAPNTPDERVRAVDAASTDFSYCVSVTGVTGARGDVATGTVDFLRRVAALAGKPFVVGFGVRGPEHVQQLGPHAAGVVVGSALIDAMAGADPPEEAAARLVAELAAAADRVRRGGEASE